MSCAILRPSSCIHAHLHQRALSWCCPCSLPEGLAQARGALGLCTQQNALFDHLTVDEHLVFFAALKADDTSANLVQQRQELIQVNSLVESAMHFCSSWL